MWKRLRACFSCGSPGNSRSTSPEKLSNVTSESETGRDKPEYAKQKSGNKQNNLGNKQNDRNLFGHQNEGAQYVQNDEQNENLRHRSSARKPEHIQDDKEETKEDLAKQTIDVNDQKSQEQAIKDNERANETTTKEISQVCESNEVKQGQGADSESTEILTNVSTTNNVKSAYYPYAKGRSIFDRFETNDSNEELAHIVEEKFVQKQPSDNLKNKHNIQEGVSVTVNNAIDLLSMTSTGTASNTAQKVFKRDVLVKEQAQVNEAELIPSKSAVELQEESIGGQHELINGQHLAGGLSNGYNLVANDVAKPLGVKEINETEDVVQINKSLADDAVETAKVGLAQNDQSVADNAIAEELNDAVAEIASLEQYLNINDNAHTKETNNVVEAELEIIAKFPNANLLPEQVSGSDEVQPDNIVKKFSEQLSKRIIDTVLQDTQLLYSQSGDEFDQNRPKSVLQFSEILAESIIRSVVDYAKVSHSHLSEHDDHDHLSPNVAAHVTNKLNENRYYVDESSLLNDDDMCSADEAHEDNSCKNLHDYAKRLSQQIVSDVLDMHDQNGDRNSTEVYAKKLAENVLSNAINSAMSRVADSHSLPDSDVGIDSALDLLVAEIVENAVEGAFLKFARESRKSEADIDDQGVQQGRQNLEGPAEHCIDSESCLGILNGNSPNVRVNNVENEQVPANGQQDIREHSQSNNVNESLHLEAPNVEIDCAIDSKNNEMGSVNDVQPAQQNGKLQSKWLCEDDLDEPYNDSLSNDEIIAGEPSTLVGNKTVTSPDYLTSPNDDKQFWRRSLIEDLDDDYSDEEENVMNESSASVDTTNANEPVHGANDMTTSNTEKQFWRKSLIEDLDDEMDFDDLDTPCSSMSSSPTKGSNLEDFPIEETVDLSDDEVIEMSCNVKAQAPIITAADSSRSRIRSVDTTPVLVLDNGSAFTKVGFSDQATPKQIVSSVVGTPLRYSQDISGMDYSASPGQVYGGNAMAKAGVLHIEYPLKPDLVERWSEVEGLWNHVLGSVMGIQDNPDFPVLISQPGLSPKKNTEKIAEIMFEHFHMPSLFIADQLALSLFSMGYTSGLSFSSGFKSTQAGVVYEGHVLPHTVKQLDISGYQLTENLKKLLMSLQGFGFRSSSQWQIVDEIKKKLGFVSLDFEADSKRYKTQAELQTPYELPDGQIIEVGLERFGCAESLFRPQEVGLTQSPAHMLIIDAINSCEEELQELCYKAMGVSGGTTQMSGFQARLEQELRNIDRKFRSFTAPEHGDLSTWLGGSVVASLPTFREMVVTVDEYAESGAKVVHSKCF